MSYEKQTWEELPSEETPFTAERMNHIEEGIDSKLDKIVVSKSLNTAGWYRVAKYNDRGQDATAFLLNVNSRYSSSAHQSATINVNVTDSKVQFTNIATLGKGSTVSKVRAVLENSEIYVEIYYAVNTSNPVAIDIVTQNAFKYRGHVVSMLNFEAPTNTATVLDELPIGEMTITNSNGTATKFPNGTMICRCTFPKEKFLNTGSSLVSTFQNVKIYRSISCDWALPENFVDKNIQININIVTEESVSYRAYMANIMAPPAKNTVAFQLNALVDFLENAEGYKCLKEVHVTAIGRWK